MPTEAVHWCRANLCTDFIRVDVSMCVNQRSPWALTRHDNDGLPNGYDQSDQATPFEYISQVLQSLPEEKAYNQMH